MNKDQLKKLEADLWSAADKLRANSDLKSSEYGTPVLGMIFLKFADNNYRSHEAEILAEYTKLKNTRRAKNISDIAIEKCGFYLPDHARYEHLLNLPEEKNIAKALKEAMKAIEEYKPELEGVLPKDEYAALTRTDKTLPQSLLRTFADIPADNSGGSATENSFDELVKFAEELHAEEERHIREGLSEDELEIFDLLKKDKMTQEETQKVIHHALLRIGQKLSVLWQKRMWSLC